MINNKVDFIATVQVKNANPNGDPLSGNQPRTDAQGFGEISDVCIKRKIRNRLQDMGQDIFVQANDRRDDDFNSLEERFKAEFPDAKRIKEEEIINRAQEKWVDIRAFGQIFTYQKLSVAIRGPVSINIAKSLSPVVVKTMQITRSSNSMIPKGEASRSADTMGSKHMVEFGVYVIRGSINAYLAEKTGFSEDDKALVKEALRTLFVNDSSSARPDGSMEVKEIFWFEHSDDNKIGNISSAKIQELLEYDDIDSTVLNPKYEDYNIRLNQEKLDEIMKTGLKVEEINGL